MTHSPYTVFRRKLEDSATDLDPLAQLAADKLKLSMAWVGHYLNCDKESEAIIILKGAYGSAVESVSLTALGLVRPAMLSLRSHYELCLQYLYFVDHPREMRSLLEYRWQGPLPATVRKYLRDHSPRFEARLATLNKVRGRSMEEVYDVLSGVAHGSALNSVSAALKPIDLVETVDSVNQSIEMFAGVSEIISDYFLSDFQSNWMSVPSVVKDNAVIRFGAKSPSIELAI